LSSDLDNECLGVCQALHDLKQFGESGSGIPCLFDLGAPGSGPGMGKNIKYAIFLIFFIRIRIKILNWIRIRIKTMRIHSPGLSCQNIIV
jgi:hypothetical protein